MRVEDVPLAPGQTWKALKAGDTEPMEVVVEIPARQVKNGAGTTDRSLTKIVGEVMNQGLPWLPGAPKAGRGGPSVSTPVTHWVGAKWENGKAYFPGCG